MNERHDCFCGCKEIRENSCSLFQAEAIELVHHECCELMLKLYTCNVFFIHKVCTYHIHTHVHTRAHMYTHTTYIYTHMYTHAHTCTHTHTHVHTCTHTHTHVYTYHTHLAMGHWRAAKIQKHVGAVLQRSYSYRVRPSSLSLTLSHSQFGSAMSVLLLTCTSTI